ncbi:MAG TPA: sulfotransferase [Tahibacter sp.]|uniref:sulfotransferase n=1 Tax=Tahibacter sp. TaxID=2056211 RepID=UPI002B935668|nr:sulfotransferase [Tahibacter sp.]HSX59755.1 sulfotransferase [Tahibacter sp.]
MSTSAFPPPPPPLQRWAGAFAARFPHVLRALARMETGSVADEIAQTPLERPVYVCGLARSGSTVLLEMLAGLPDFVSWRYSDYPLQWLPYWWNALRRRLPLPATAPVERAHRDRLLVGPDSPEAFEECFWQAFFPARHDEGVDQRLDGTRRDAAFDRFYRDQVRKLLTVRGGRRYLCKGNYNALRLGYLHALWPDARFLVAARAPQAQIASLIKQDLWFRRWAAEDPRIGRQLAERGHFEFGPQKRVQHCGDAEAARAIRAAWDAGDAVTAYALQWREVYGSVLDGLERDAGLRRACLLVHYESLCADPAAGLARIAGHVGLAAEPAERLVSGWRGRLTLPDYYDDGFMPADRERIAAITAGVDGRLREFAASA